MPVLYFQIQCVFLFRENVRMCCTSFFFFFFRDIHVLWVAKWFLQKRGVGWDTEFWFWREESKLERAEIYICFCVMPKNSFLNIHWKLFYTDNVNFIQVILSIVIQMVEPQHFCLQCLKTGGLTVVLKNKPKLLRDFFLTIKTHVPTDDMVDNNCWHT